MKTPRAAIERSAGAYLYKFVLAALQDLFDGLEEPDGYPYPAEEGFDSFENLVAEQPVKAGKRAVTVMRDAKLILAAFFASIVSVVKESRTPIPAARPVTHLVNTAAPRSGEVRFMSAVVEAMRGRINAGFLARDFDAVACFAAKLEALVAPKHHVAAGSQEIARLYVNFLKCIAWATANVAIEHKVTVNGWLIRGLLRNYGALPNIDNCEGVMSFLRAQAAWAAAQERLGGGAAGRAPQRRAAVQEPAPGLGPAPPPVEPLPQPEAPGLLTDLWGGAPTTANTRLGPGASASALPQEDLGVLMMWWEEEEEVSAPPPPGGDAMFHPTTANTRPGPGASASALSLDLDMFVGLRGEEEKVAAPAPGGDAMSHPTSEPCRPHLPRVGPATPGPPSPFFGGAPAYDQDGGFDAFSISF